MIAIVEDDKDIRNLIKLALEKEGFKTVTFSSGEEFLMYPKLSSINLLILDIMLKNLDGFQVLDILRQEGFDFPVLVLTALGEEKDKEKGFNYGADDYLVKPFSIKELVLRVKALLRRISQDKEVYNLGKIKFFPKKALIIDFQGKELFLTPKESKILEIIIKKDIAIKEEILKEVWGSLEYARTLDVHIRRIRQKLESYGIKIITLKGIGYKLKIKEEEDGS
ncbi:MAG TPA: response regulator transcription factor [Aquificae bacterium]|nr:response regulator transcription factor [Aquificota bacterium]